MAFWPIFTPTPRTSPSIWPSIWMSSVLSSSPVILRALLITDAMDAPALVGVDVEIEDDLAMATAKIGSASAGFGAAVSTLGGGGWGVEAWRGAAASPDLSLRLNNVMHAPPEVGRVFRNS